MSAPAVSRASREGRALLPVVLTATFMQLLDVTIVQIAAPAIRDDLRAGSGALELVLAGYTLAYAVTLVPGARLGDRYGCRRLFVTGMTVFVGASAGCSLAPGATGLVAARIVQGVGSGLMAPQVLSLIQTGLPVDRRPRALGLFGATMGAASLGGPLVGGLLLGADVGGLGWRALFAINIPVGLGALVAAGLLPGHRGAGRVRLDVPGALLLATGTALVLLPVTLGHDAGWPPWTWVSLAAAPPVLAGFTAVQRRRPDPLVHPRTLSDPGARAGVALVAVIYLGVPAFTYVLFLYLQDGLGLAPLGAALLAAPYPAAAVLGSSGATRVARRSGARVLPATTLVLAAVMVALAIIALTPATPGWLTSLVLAAGGAAFGVFTATVFSQVLARIPTDAAGSASGVLQTAQQLGGSLGVALVGLAGSVAVTARGSFAAALVYETGVFLAAAVLARRVVRS